MSETKLAGEWSTTERVKIMTLADQIDFNSRTAVASYGLSAQQDLGKVANKVLSSVSARSPDETDALLTKLRDQLREFDDYVASRRPRFFAFSRKDPGDFQTNCKRIERVLNQLSKQLTGQKLTLQVDIAKLDELRQANQSYLRQLQLNLAAGELKLAAVRDSKVSQVQHGDALLQDNMTDVCRQFANRLHSMRQTLLAYQQAAAQIDLVQSIDIESARRIDESLHAIPLWKSTISTTLALKQSRASLKMTRECNQKLAKTVDAFLTTQKEGDEARTTATEMLSQFKAGTTE